MTKTQKLAKHYAQISAPRKAALQWLPHDCPNPSSALTEVTFTQPILIFIYTCSPDSSHMLGVSLLYFLESTLTNMISRTSLFTLQKCGNASNLVHFCPNRDNLLPEPVLKISTDIRERPCCCILRHLDLRDHKQIFESETSAYPDNPDKLTQTGCFLKHQLIGFHPTRPSHVDWAFSAQSCHFNAERDIAHCCAT